MADGPVADGPMADVPWLTVPWPWSQWQDEELPGSLGAWIWESRDLVGNPVSSFARWGSNDSRWVPLRTRCWPLLPLVLGAPPAAAGRVPGAPFIQSRARLFPSRFSPGSCPGGGDRSGDISVTADGGGQGCWEHPPCTGRPRQGPAPTWTCRARNFLEVLVASGGLGALESGTRCFLFNF